MMNTAVRAVKPGPGQSFDSTDALSPRSHNNPELMTSNPTQIFSFTFDGSWFTQYVISG
jgi:hypothetical protein